MMDGANHNSFPGKPPQFALRTLLLGVTLCCILFGLMRIIGPLASSALVFFLLLVALHVGGNVLGTSLSSKSPRKFISSAVDDGDGPPLAIESLALSRRKPPGPSRLRERTSVGWSIVISTGLGSMFGGSLGWLGYYFLVHTTTAGIVVGSVSSAVLGGFFGFLTASFLSNILRAWRQALATAHS